MEQRVLVNPVVVVVAAVAPVVLVLEITAALVDFTVLVAAVKVEVQRQMVAAAQCVLWPPAVHVRSHQLV